jgi:hypothetical protein
VLPLAMRFNTSSSRVVRLSGLLCIGQS